MTKEGKKIKISSEEEISLTQKESKIYNAGWESGYQTAGVVVLGLFACIIIMIFIIEKC